MSGFRFEPEQELDPGADSVRKRRFLFLEYVALTM